MKIAPTLGPVNSPLWLASNRCDWLSRLGSTRYAHASITLGLVFSATTRLLDVVTAFGIFLRLTCSTPNQLDVNDLT
jgi:hypothetical protein